VADQKCADFFFSDFTRSFHPRTFVKNPFLLPSAGTCVLLLQSAALKIRCVYPPIARLSLFYVDVFASLFFFSSFLSLLKWILFGADFSGVVRGSPTLFYKKPSSSPHVARLHPHFPSRQQLHIECPLQDPILSRMPHYPPARVGFFLQSAGQDLLIFSSFLESSSSPGVCDPVFFLLADVVFFSLVIAVP